MSKWKKRFKELEQLTKTEAVKPKTEERAFTYQEGIASGLVLEPVDSGVSVNNEKALTISSMFAGIRHISESIASLPKRLMRKMPDGGKIADEEHPAHQLIAHEPNTYMTSAVFTEWFFVQACLYSNAYSKLVRNGAGRVVEIHPLPAPYVQIGWDIPTRTLTYYVMASPYTEEETLDSSDVLHVPGLSLDGIFGLNPLEYCRQSHGLSIALEKFASSFFRGARPSGVLETDSQLSDLGRQNLKKSFNDQASGASSTGKTPILEEGLKWKPMSYPQNECQYIETRQYQNLEAAHWCKIPLVKIDPMRATWNNIETYNMQYIQESISPWIIKAEQELDKKLLLPSEKGKYCFEFDLSGLLRGDKKTRYACYALALQNKQWMTEDEVREQEGMPPLTDEQREQLAPAPEPVEDDDQDEDDEPQEQDGADTEEQFGNKDQVTS